jgi:molybdate transport system substrate-binding protein
LASVQSGNVDAGFVYRTDAALSKKVRVAYKVPRDDAPAITYPAAIIRASKEKQIARDFLNFVTGAYGREIFIKYGFIPLN